MLRVSGGRASVDEPKVAQQYTRKRDGAPSTVSLSFGRRRSTSNVGSNGVVAAVVIPRFDERAGNDVSRRLLRATSLRVESRVRTRPSRSDQVSLLDPLAVTNMAELAFSAVDGERATGESRRVERNPVGRCARLQILSIYRIYRCSILFHATIEIANRHDLFGLRARN